MRIFVLEGINAAGKSLAAKTIRNAIHQLGAQCLVVDPAAYGPVGQLLRERIVDPSFRDNANLDAVLFAALRAEGAEQILSELGSSASITLVLERWSLALAAYGKADGARPQLVSELRATLNSLLSVDFTFLLDLNGSAALARLAKLSRRNRFELRGEPYLECVAEAYREAARHDSRVNVIDAQGSPAEVCEQIRIALCTAYSEFSGLNFTSLGTDSEQLDLHL